MLSPRAKADRDWKAQLARAYRAGLYRGSAIDEESGLIVKELGCFINDEIRRFTNEYNRRIEELVREQGIPSWAPIRRCPPDEEMPRLLAEGVPVLTVEDERRWNPYWGMTNEQYDAESYELMMVRRLDDKRVVLVGCELVSLESDQATGRGVISVYELIRGRLGEQMNTIVLDRMKTGSLPWDSFGAVTTKAIMHRRRASAAEREADERRLHAFLQAHVRVLKKLTKAPLACIHCRRCTKAFKEIDDTRAIVCLACGRSCDVVALDALNEGAPQ